MIRVHVLCEGATEEAFVKALMAPHFENLGTYLYPSLLGKPGHKGGNVGFERLLTDTRNRLLGDSSAYCTTFFDFYALPTDFPGKAAALKQTTVSGKALAVCTNLVSALQGKFGEKPIQRFVPFVQMYEFEALLFSDAKGFAKGIDRPTLAKDFQRIRDSFSSPEAINDSAVTAPSKRIQSLVSTYQKPLHGPLAALAIGLPTIRRECALFDSWLKKLETLSPATS